MYDSEFLVSFTISDIDYAGVIFCYWLDRKTGQFEETTVMTPLGRGCHLGQIVTNHSRFEGKVGHLDFIVTDPMGYELKVDFHTGKQEPILSNLKIDVPIDWESLNVVVPWTRNRFQFTEKLFGLGAEGEVQIGSRSHKFQKKNSFAVLDFGRGVWPYFTKWNWASMSFRPNSKEVYGVNLGAGWTDGTGSTENGILINGRLYKIPSDVAFDFEKENPMRPWHLYTKDSKAIELTLHPTFHRSAKSNVGIIASSVDQMLGEFEGVIRLGKKEYKIKKGLGWAEDHVARW